MQPATLKGKEIIAACKTQLTINLACLTQLIKDAKTNTTSNNVHDAKNQVANAMDLSFQSRSLAYIAREGLIVDVINESSDGIQHQKITHINQKLHSILWDYYKVSKDNNEIEWKLSDLLLELEKIKKDG